VSWDEVFYEWVLNFYNWNTYKLLIEQKAKTDPAYVFQGTEPEPLTVDIGNLTGQQQELARKIGQRLRDH
jgi:hypothetical protein